MIKWSGARARPHLGVEGEGFASCYWPFSAHAVQRLQIGLVGANVAFSNRTTRTFLPLNVHASHEYWLWVAAAAKRLLTARSDCLLWREYGPGSRSAIRLALRRSSSGVDSYHCTRRHEAC